MIADIAETVMAMAEHGNNGHTHGYTFSTVFTARHNNDGRNGGRHNGATRLDLDSHLLRAFMANWSTSLILQTSGSQGTTSAAEGHQRLASFFIC
jgi:hypothetical protein